MKQVTLDEYKTYLISNYKYEYDNTKYQISKRESILKNKYKDDYLENIILGTYTFVNKILEMSKDNYYGYIEIPLKIEPDIIYIDLDLCGGYKSDTLVKDTNNNFYSIGLLKKIFGPFFYIEPCRVELNEEIDGDDDFAIMYEVPSYYLYIQCKKEVIDNVRNLFSESEKIKKVLSIRK